MRERQSKEDEEFGNYLEDLLSQPYVRQEVQEHGLAWLKSKIRIDEFQKAESEAAEVIARFAFDRFRKDQSMTDFLLAGPTARVRIRIFRVERNLKTIYTAA